MDKNFGDYLKRIAPSEMREFFQTPWDYEVHGPISTEDPAVIEVHLEIGRTRAEKIIDITIDLYTNRSTIKTTNKTTDKSTSPAKAVLLEGGKVNA
jgi:hypothetical protein